MKNQPQRMLRQTALIEEAPNAIFVEDLEGRILSWNRGAERIYGWDWAYAIGQRSDELFRIVSDGAGKSSASLLEHGDWSGELVKSTSTGAVKTVDSRVTLLRGDEGRPESVLVIDTDLTDRKNLERQFLRAQRLQSIGTLAGGIAHDLNNMLMPILMGATLLKRLSTDANSLKAIENIERSARRGAELVKQVLSFERGVEGSRISVHPKLVLDEIRSITETTFPKNIAVHIEVEEGIGSILGDPTQISQVLLNLCVNARDAMPDGGTLSLLARSVDVGSVVGAGLKDRQPGSYIVLQVSDTGSGMSQEVMDRIFEPFFSTKEITSGTGLGLSTSFGIVQSHGGFLNVYSEPGRGSVLSAYFPVEQEVAAGLTAKGDADSTPRGEGQWILVVDDEAPIIAVTRQTLESFGYQVMTAANGEEALRIYTGGAPKIDLVLTDMMMPIMDGPALITELERIDPQIKLICASGMNINANLATASSSRPRNFLSKPYGVEVLLAMIHRVLSS